jgi:hypothetical protein
MNASLNLSIRSATKNDMPFLVKAFIEASKSGSNVCFFAVAFGLDEQEAKLYLADMFAAGIDNCRFSLSAYLIAEVSEGNCKIPIAGSAAWIEGLGGNPSDKLETDLLFKNYPKTSFRKLFEIRSIIKEMGLTRTKGSLQWEMLFTNEKYRGYGLQAKLIERHMNLLQKIDPDLHFAETQMYKHNLSALKSAYKLGFEIVEEKYSVNPDVKLYYPGNTICLLRKKILAN